MAKGLLTSAQVLNLRVVSSGPILSSMLGVQPTLQKEKKRKRNEGEKTQTVRFLSPKKNMEGSPEASY